MSDLTRQMAVALEELGEVSCVVGDVPFIRNQHGFQVCTSMNGLFDVWSIDGTQPLAFNLSADTAMTFVAA